MSNQNSQKNSSDIIFSQSQSQQNQIQNIFQSNLNDIYNDNDLWFNTHNSNLDAGDLDNLESNLDAMINMFSSPGTNKYSISKGFIEKYSLNNT
jgi:hypothetical protein